MNVIKFPKCCKRKYKTNDKLRIAYKLIDIMNENGMDFHIVIEREAAEIAFELDGKEGNNIIMTSNLEKAEALNIRNALYFPIDEDEF